MLVFGGLVGPAPTSFNDTWELDFSPDASANGLVMDSGTDTPAAGVIRFHLALESVYPNPASQEMNVRFTLASSADARIELYDVRGRRVELRRVGSLGPGRHQIELNEDRRLGGGIYFLRLVQSGEAVSTKVAIMP